MAPNSTYVLLCKIEQYLKDLCKDIGTDLGVVFFKVIVSTACALIFFCGNLGANISEIVAEPPSTHFRVLRVAI